MFKSKLLEKPWNANRLIGSICLGMLLLGGLVSYWKDTAMPLVVAGIVIVFIEKIYKKQF